MSGVESVIEIKDLEVTLGEFTLQKVSMDIKRSEYLILLGPTGSGKTVFLETIVGLHRPESGTIKVNGTVVNELCPEDRNIGYVPQDYSLFPNMTVSENIAFGPMVRDWPKKRIANRVDELMELLAIGYLSDRYPNHLSGGEKQRVAMGRALAVEPEVLILDEPLSALDESLRAELAAGLRSIQQSISGTFLHVCHNLDEAAQVASRVTIINSGRVVQTGTVSEILYEPKTTFVAKFTGTKNVFAIKKKDNELILEDGTKLPLESPVTGASHLAIRSEALTLTESNDGSPFNLSGIVQSIVSRAVSHELVIKLHDSGTNWSVIVPRTQRHETPRIGDEAHFLLPSEDFWFIEQ